MRASVLASMLGFSALLAAGNNLFNPHRVPWIGSGEVLPKPEGWPALTFAQGAGGGLKFAWNLLREHGMGTAAAVLLLMVALVAARRRHKPGQNVVKSWLRLGLGLMFLVAASPKFSAPKDFALLVTQYQLLPLFAVNAFSLWLPAAEITAGVTLLFTPFETEAAAAVLLLLGMFVIALSQALGRGLGIACGCFDIEGAADAAETWFALLRDVFLLFPVAWMWIKSERRFGWHF